jgi:hypothetical protein
MLIYNITTKVEHTVAHKWVQWMKEEHIPAILQTEKFIGSNFSKLLDVDESDGITYVLQFFAKTKNDYDQYIREYSAQLRNEAMEKWGAGFISFKSLMEEV